MTPKHIVVAIAAAFATSAFAAGDQAPKQREGAAPSQSQGQQAQSHSPEVVKQVQQQLSQKGFDVGAVDGKWGPKTQQGVKQFQQSQNIQPSGQLDQQTLAALGVQEQSSSIGGSGANAGSSGKSQQPAASGSGSQGASGSSQSPGASGSGGSQSGSSGSQQKSY